MALPLGLLDALRRALLGLSPRHDALDDLSWQMQALAEREAFEALER